MSAHSGDGARDTLNALIEEMGEPMVIERDAYVPMEDGAIEKLKHLRG